VVVTPHKTFTAFVSDAIGTFTMAMHRATIEQNWPRCAHRILTIDDLVGELAPDASARAS
jgi:hypothetical protein